MCAAREGPPLTAKRGLARSGAPRAHWAPGFWVLSGGVVPVVADPAEKREKQAFRFPSEYSQGGAGVRTWPSRLWVLMLDVEALGLLAPQGLDRGAGS